MAEPEPRALRCFDVYLPGFAALILALVALRPELFPDPGFVLALFGLLAVLSLLYAVLLRRQPRAAGWPAVVAASVLLLATYGSLAAFLPWSLPAGRAEALLVLDRRFFGYEWQRWWPGLVHPLATDFLHLVYASFYACPFVFGLLLARRGGWAAVGPYCDRVILVFLLSYCGYLLVPARSPYEVQRFSEALPSFGLSPWLHAHTVGLTATRHDCFPSGHVMVTAYVAGLSRRCGRAVFLGFAAWALLTVLATLYLRYHYLVDVLAGAVAGLLCVPLLDGWRRSTAAGPLTCTDEARA